MLFATRLHGHGIWLWCADTLHFLSWPAGFTDLVFFNPQTDRVMTKRVCVVCIIFAGGLPPVGRRFVTSSCYFFYIVLPPNRRASSFTNELSFLLSIHRTQQLCSGWLSNVFWRFGCR